MKVLFALLVLVAGCSRPAPTSHEPRYGAVMSEVGRRFELAGRAASANRFELAAFEVGELQELFDGDLRHAELPKEGDTTVLPAMADAFAKTNAPALLQAAKSKDARAFADAFERAAAACNGCHQASGHGFIEVPKAPGKAIPDLDAVPR
jgi:cytochrome c553